MSDDATPDGDASGSGPTADPAGDGRQSAPDGGGTGESAASDDPLAWATVGGEQEYESPAFAVRRDDVRYPDGSEGEYHYVEDPPAVVILPLTDGGDVVAIEEWRQAVGRVNRGLPAGTVEPDEAATVDDPTAADAGADLTVAAERELREETGYVAEEVTHLCTVEPSNGLAASVHHHFVARGCTPAAEQALDDGESIRAERVAYDDLLAAALSGELRDGRAVLALTRYELERQGD